MTRTPRFVAALLWLTLSAAIGQTESTSVASDATTVAKSSVVNSELGAEAFYELLLGELNMLAGEPAAGFSLILNTARKTNDAQVFQRAVEMALQSRSGEAALQASKAWHQAQPNSREANRAVLQILLAMNRLNDTLEPLKSELALAPPANRAQAIAAIPRNFLQASDKKLATTVVERALADYTGNPTTSSAAWTAIGQMRLGNDDLSGTLEAIRKAQASDATATDPMLLALDLVERKQAAAEGLVRQRLDKHPNPELRMGYARALTNLKRYPDAIAQLKQLTHDKPELPESWLLLGSLQFQENQAEAAEVSLGKYVELATVEGPGNEANKTSRSRGSTQAYLLLAQIAEERKDYAAAQAWLARTDSTADVVRVQSRRASLLARQGKLDEARELLRSLPEKEEGDARLKASAEAQLLRDNKQYPLAYEVLAAALAKAPDDADLLYEQAMVAEKLDRMDEMERLLRRVIELKPESHHAFNALGYSLADRNVRVPEAKQLILKALEAAPDDPFIQDSLAWAEFRMGNKAEALKILEAAFKAKADVEIATHLGEVLWSLGLHTKAIAVWKEALRMGRDNESLQETLKRLRVPL